LKNKPRSRLAGSRKIKRNPGKYSPAIKLKVRSKADFELWNQGCVFCGIDEVGRGALAGPVVAAAVILPPFTYIKGIKDSKQLTPKSRERFYSLIKEKALAVGVGSATHKEIDRLNIRNASFLAMKRAIRDLIKQEKKCERAIVDGFEIPKCEIPNKGIIKGDEKSVSIACASIIAKVFRDRLMSVMHNQYPSYNFARNKGYPSPYHLKALKQNGPSFMHRKSFRPVKSVL
jgi:ribonuclease HII